MRRYAIVLLLSLMLVLVGWAGPVYAAADDDVPGASLSIGDSLSGTVGGGDVHDVYSVDLVAGEEVRISCTPHYGASASGKFRVLVPGAGSITQPDDYAEIIYSVSSGSMFIFYAEFEYMPARSGTYYLWMEGTSGTLAYDLSVKRTTRASVAGPDADDIPGLPAGVGSVEGVIDTFTDRDDVYAVKLFAGEQVNLTFEPLDRASDKGNLFAQAWVRLLDPSSTSVKGYDYTSVADDNAVNSQYDGYKLAQITYTPTTTGTYFIWAQASFIASNFPYRLTISGSAEPPPEEPPISFPDVPAAHPYYTAVMDLAARNIIGGYENGYFGLNDAPKRAQFAKMILGTLGISCNPSTTTRFTDLGVPNAQGYPHVWVQAAFDHGITYGTNQAQTLYDPWRFIHRDQVVSMIVRGVNQAAPGVLATPPAGYGLFAQVGAPHGENLRIAEYNSLLEGLVGLGPSWDVAADATRGEVAQMLHNLLGKLGAP